MAEDVLGHGEPLDDNAEDRAAADLEPAQEVDISEPETDVDSDEEESSRPSRKERRANRFREAHERAAAAEAEAKALREQAQQYKQMLDAERQARSTRTRGDVDAPDTADQHVTALNKLRTERRAVLSKIYGANGQLSRADIDALEKEAEEIEDKIHQVQVNRFTPKPKPGSNMATVLQAKYPDVYQNPAARMWAQGYASQMAAKGRKAGMQLAEEALQEAAKEFGLSERGPAKGAKDRYAGRPKGAAATRSDKKTVRVTGRQKLMALAMYPNEDEKTAVRKWAKRVGSKINN